MTEDWFWLVLVAFVIGIAFGRNEIYAKMCSKCKAKHDKNVAKAQAKSKAWWKKVGDYTYFWNNGFLCYIALVVIFHLNSGTQR